MKIRKTDSSILIGLLLLLLLSGTPAASAVAADAVAFEKKIRTFTLANGLQVLLLERRLSPSAAFYIRYRTGAVDEESGKTGMAHLLEHMMFKGTKTIGSKDFAKESRILARIAATGQALDEEKARGAGANQGKIGVLQKELKALQQEGKTLLVSNEIDRLYTENGAVRLNASTGQDVTTYHVSLPANKIELWARIESDRMANTVFREFYQERDVVLEERAQRIDSDPDGKLFEEYLAAAYAAHPYRRPVIGWPSDIRQLGMADLETFYRKTHAPNNTVIAVVGDIDPAAVRRIIEKYFGWMPRQESIGRRITEEPRQMGEKRVSVHLDANPQMMIGYHKPGLASPDDYVFEVIESILSRGRTSRFYKTLVAEKGLAESVQASNGTPAARYPDLFTISATPRHPHSNAELEAAIYEILEKLKKEPVSDQELARVKNQVFADFIRQQASNEGLASMLSYFQTVLGDFRYITEYMAKIEKVTADDIRRVASQYFIRDNRTVASVTKD